MNYRQLFQSFTDATLNESDSIDAIPLVLRAIRRHMKATVAFQRELSKLDSAQLLKCAKDMASSWKLEVSAVGITSDEVFAYVDSIHKEAKRVRTVVYEKINAAQEVHDFNACRAASVHLVNIEVLLSSVSTFKDSYNAIKEVLAKVA